MKRTIINAVALLFAVASLAQASDYRTTEDGLNRLLNNPDFIKDVIEAGSEGFSVQKIDTYFAKYAPEYGDFKTKEENIDVSKLYLTNTGSLSATDMIGKLGTAFKMKPNDLQNMQNVFMGNAKSTNTGGLKNMVYDRGKDKKTDMAVDFGVDFFQRKFATNKLQSGLMDLGGGLFGGLINKLNQRYYEKMAEEAVITALLSDSNVYTMGGTSPKPEQQDLLMHHKADVKAGISIMNLSMVPKAPDYEGAIADYDKAIEAYKLNAERAYYLYKAFVDRGRSKMQIGAYRAAVNDYYLAESLLGYILNKSLPDKSIDMIYPQGYFDASNKKTHLKGKTSFKKNLLSNKDLMIVTIDRAFAKYRLGDYTGAIADCKLANEILAKSMVSPTALPNDYRDIILAVTAMSEFGLGKFAESHATFSSANLNDELILDNDNDGITNFLDTAKAGLSHVLDKAEGIMFTEFYGLPEYFPFDISQIRGLSLYKANKIDEAILIYENILNSEKAKAKYTNEEQKTFTKIGGDISALYSTLSSFYYAKGDKAKAVSLIEQAIKLNPDYTEYTAKKAVYDKEMGVKSTVANPKSSKTEPAKPAKKDKDFYLTKHASLFATGKKEDDYVLLSEAAQNYPDDFFKLLLANVQESKDPAKAETVAKIYSADAMKSAVFNIVQNQLSGNVAKEQEYAFAAFENGLNFYDADVYYKLALRKRSYYCKLFIQYGSDKNNNFFSPNEDKAVVKRMLDSTYQDIETNPQYQMAAVKKMMKSTREKQYTKAFGTVSEYLKVLEDQENISGSVPSEILDRVEALIILKRNAEAIKFAKSALKDKKFKMVTQYITDDMTKGWVTGIENIANGSCGG